MVSGPEPGRRKKNKEPGLRLNNEPGLIIPVIVPASREDTIIRIGRDDNGCTIINAPKRVQIVKRDKRSGKSN